MEINYVCSLGGMCHSSQILKRNKLKLCSYPFDWIFSNCNNIIHCIEDDFKIFLDKNYYNSIGPDICEHTYYYKKGCGTNMFNHFNPLINENSYNYYVRCVDRFKLLLQYKEHKLFTMIFINMDNIDENIKDNIIEFNNKFSKYTNNYTLLVILHLKHKQTNYHNFTYNNNIHFLELHTLSSSGGSKFDNENDNEYLDNILHEKYTFNIKN